MKNKKNLYRLKTPCYIINKEIFKKNLSEITTPFNNVWNNNIIVGYSIKTNHNKDLIRISKECGMYAETVSDDEYMLAEKIGYTPDMIIYNGPQKSEELLINALRLGSIVNIDNMNEIAMIEKNIDLLVNTDLKLGLRVNFNLEKKCPEETSAGKEVSRFGICVENGDLKKAILRLNEIGISIRGLHIHYSSKTRSLNIFKELSKEICRLIDIYKLTDIEYIDIGGGFFGGQIVAGKPSMKEYATTIANELNRKLNSKDVKLILEPGASLIATAVDYLCKIINIRNIRNTIVVTTDGSNIHINPFLVNREPKYQIISNNKEVVESQIVCGATCMENDRIIRLQNEVKIDENDLLYCYNTGAYTMGFNSCFINLPPYIYLNDGKEYKLLREKKLKIMMEI